MLDVLPMLDEAKFVYRWVFRFDLTSHVPIALSRHAHVDTIRYAWMSARDPSGKRGLVEDDGKGGVRLTSLGKIWNSR